MMDTKKSYFRSCLKENFLPLLFITLVALVYCLISAVLYQPYRLYLDEQNYTTYYRATLNYPVVVLGLLCYIVPVLQFGRFKKRKNLDLYYSVPVSRTTLGISHYLVGLITVILPFTLCYLENFIVMLTRPAGTFDFLPMLGHFSLCLVLGVASYSLFAFVFNQANTVLDGCVFIGIYSIAFLFLSEPINLMLGDAVNMRSFGLEPVSLLGNITLYFENMVEMQPKYGGSFFYYNFEIWQVVVWLAIGLICAILFVKLFGTQGAEKTEEISDSWFGYRILIPVLACLAMLIYMLPPTDAGIITWFWVEAFALLAYVVYRREIRLKKSDVAVLVALFAFIPLYLI